MSWPERRQLLESLKDPIKIENNQRKWRETIRRKRPWVFIADLSIDSWSREGRGNELGKWLERLEMIDESMVPYTQELVNAFENVAPEKEFENIVSKLEEKQHKRFSILDEMVTHLRDHRGWELTKLEGDLQQRYSEVGRIQEMDSILSEIEECINEGIVHFDEKTALNLLQKSKLAQKMEDKNRLNEIKLEAEKKSTDYATRLIKINLWLDQIRINGMHINAPTNATPEDLLLLENRVPDIDEKIVRLNEIWILLDQLLDLFPEHAGVAVALQGQVERIDQITELLHLLEDLRDEREQQSRSRINSWKESGFEVDPLETLLNNSPRLGWLAIDEHANKIHVCKQLLATIDSLDVSFYGAEDVNNWIKLLHNLEINTDDYNQIQDGISKLLRRNHLHREKLDKIRLDLASIWPVETNPNLLNLLDYEELITSLQSGIKIQYKELHNQEDRLLIATIAELDMWRQEGWDVTNLDDLIKRDHIELWIQLPEIRRNISQYSRLKERLERLPFGRDLNLLNDVIRKTSMPDQLNYLFESIPEMAKHLSALPENDEIESIFFTPKPPEVFAKLHPLKPILIPVLEENRNNNQNERQKSETLESNNHKEDLLNNLVKRENNHSQDLYESDEIGNLLNEQRLSNLNFDSVREKIGGDLDKSPRDIRVQRLVILLDALRSLGGVSDEKALSLLHRLETIGDQLSKWTSLRLDSRQCPSKGNLLEISKRLAIKLEEIPGPGVDLPRHLDLIDSTKLNDIVAIENQVEALEKATFIPLAGTKNYVKAL